MKFCYNCGTEIEEGDKFCVECGADLSLVDVEEIQRQKEEEQAQMNEKMLRERQRQEEMRLNNEKQRQEAELREAQRQEADRKRCEEEYLRRKENRKRLEMLDVERKEKERAESGRKTSENNKAAVAFLLFLFAVIAVIVSIMYINEYNKKHNADNGDESVSDNNNPNVTIVSTDAESTRAYVSETTTQSENVNNTTEEPDGYVSNGPYAGCQFLDIEEIPKYLDGNLTTAQIGLVLDGLTSAHSKGITSREDIFSEILEQLEIYAVPGFTYKYLSKSEDVHVYDYTEYSYRDIKRLFTIILDDDEFDTFASNRNWSRYEEIIDKDSDVFRVEYFGMEVDENDWVYDSLKPMYFYIEDGKYYIEKCGTVFELYQTGNGKMKIDYSTIRKRW